MRITPNKLEPAAARAARRLAATLALAALGALGACTRTPPEARRLELVRVQPQNRSGVFLNEDLVFTFSRELDSNSITDHSVRVVDAAGRPARGKKVVHATTLRFQPEPVLATSLADGGYLPGERYTVTLLGFPALAGVRSAEGVPLDRSFQWTYEIVDPAAPDRGVVFDDASPAQGSRLLTTTKLDQTEQPRQRHALLPMEPSDAILLTCAEPLDPSTLFDEDFILRGASLRGPGEAPLLERIGLRARVIQNYDEGELPPGVEHCCLIELLPRRRLQAETDYEFGFDPGLRLRDFGGNQVWRKSISPSFDKIRVVPERAREVLDSLTLDFLDGDHFIPLSVEGMDGTADWGPSGRLELLYPVAAGSGVDGAVTLSEELQALDLNTTRLELPEGVRCPLPQLPGLCVLRSQGRMEIAGELSRAHTSRGEAPAAPFTNLDRRSLPRTNLSQWLNSMRASTEEWTVLIAGGDLLIDGSIRVETPLLLVAGGRIRVSGEVRAPEGALWLFGSGGGLSMDPTKSIPNFVLDPPLQNPLEETLRFAAVSSQIPNLAAALDWNTPRVSGHSGSGSYRVRYLPATGPIDRELAVDHPRLLEGGGPLRLLIELELPKHAAIPEAWDPPWIDSIHLSWSRLDPRGER